MRLSVTLLLVSIAACNGSPTQPDRVRTGQAFDLGVGQTATTTDDVRIRFDTVRSDSRCPMDVFCVRAGEAVIAITLSLPGEAAVGRELETVPPRSQVTHSRFTVTLSELQPYPRSDRPTQPNDYIATFVVSVR
jgi:hypothetical protein